MKKKLQVFTKETHKFIPTNVAIIKNPYGWTFVFMKETQIYMDSTNSGKDCPEEENEFWLKEIVKVMKEHMKKVK